MSSCSADFNSTNRIVGRVAASAIASASPPAESKFPARRQPGALSGELCGSTSRKLAAFGSYFLEPADPEWVSHRSGSWQLRFPDAGWRSENEGNSDSNRHKISESTGS